MEFILIYKKEMVLLLATLLSGLLAGVFFTWTNAITPGIGRLNDVYYLQAFQHMNRTIINPLFYIVIIGPLFLSPLSALLFRSSDGIVAKILLLSSILYYLGVFGVTIAGNIPLNIKLDQLELTKISLDEARIFREGYEARWNKLHLIRTISSASSFLLLILACLYSNLSKNNLNP